MDKFQTLADTGNDYKTAKDKLATHFKPKATPLYEESVFREMKQNKGETVNQYRVRLRAQAPKCPELSEGIGKLKGVEVPVHIDNFSF